MTHAGDAIRVMRQAQGLTLRELAGMSETSYTYLSLVERGLRTPTEAWLQNVREALGRHLISGAA